MKELLRQLCVDQGVSGCEPEMLPVIQKLMGDYAAVTTDCCGNIIATMGKQNAEKHILLDAHIDRIGLVITYLDEKGFLCAAPVGGIDLRTLPGSTVTILGKEPVTGVICTTPPHLGEETELSRDKIRIDTGLPVRRVQELIQPGDRAVLCSPFLELLGNRIAVSSLDNRSGCAVLIRCAELLRNKELFCRVSFVFSVQEETNECGAAAAAFTLEPDEAIVVDVGFAAQEGVPPEKSGKLGCGGIISIAPGLSDAVTRKIQKIAARLGMNCDYEVCGGNTGTNADKISVSKGGIPTGVISVPSKNMHTQTEIVDLEDMERIAKLLSVYINEGGADHD